MSTFYFTVTNRWEGGWLLSHKAPTCFLFDRDGQFDSFGHEAEERYMELVTDEDEDVEEWNGSTSRGSRWNYMVKR